MRLKLFDTIDKTLDTLERNHDIYVSIEKELKAHLYHLFEGSDSIIDIMSRIKTKESLREKIIRNRFYLDFNEPDEILANLSDLIGCIIECRFIEEEYMILKHLREYYNIKDENGYYYHKDFEQIHIDIQSSQPKIQKNGFSMYRIDGYYLKDGHKVNFELQIKALVHAFWGEIEHKLVYKNTNYYVYDDFMKDILASIKANLTIMDRQLNIVYNQIQDMSKTGSSINETSLEKLINKAINDLFAMKMNESIGFTLNIKNTSSILGHYIFLKNIRYENGKNDGISTLFRTFKKINNVEIDFENEIKFEQNFESKDPFIHILGNYLLSIINKDYDWFVFFNMLFAIEPGNNLEDFTLFMNVIENYFVDDYWFKTSFVRLSMKDSEQVQHSCISMLAKSLVEVGSIKIIYNEKMELINKAFVNFINELETRVMSYNDFKHYEEAYYEDWLNRVKNIF